VRSITIVALAAAVILAYLYVTQRSLIYFPGSTIPGGDLLPAESQVVELHTADGLRLSGWFLPASGQPSRSGAEPTPGPAVLIWSGRPDL
jgi:hypothetical protein